MQKIIVKAEEQMLSAIEKALKCAEIEYTYKDSGVEFTIPTEAIEPCTECEDGIVLLENIINRAKYEYC